jgi:nucleoside-diphosphate-sugar epimerase
MRVFVTGATGVIGIRALPLLVAAGHSVTAAVRSEASRRRVDEIGASSTSIDLFDPRSVRRAIAGHDAVVNLATHMPSSSVKMMLPWSWRENDRIRRVGSATIVDAAIVEGVPRLIQESFAPAYVDHGDGWIDETWPISPVRYNLTIQDAERSAERFMEAARTGVILRFAALYGPDPLLRDMLRAIKAGWSPLPGAPSAYVTSVSQDDAAAAVAAALGVPSGTYNVGETDPMRRGDWAASLAEAAGLPRPKPLPQWITKLVGGTAAALLSRSQRISSAKLRGASTWTPRYVNAAAAWPDVLAQLDGARPSA